MSHKYVSASQINIGNYCRRRYYLAYIDPDKPKRLRLSAYVKGSLLHSLKEHFWNKHGTIEECQKKSSGKKYYDKNSFADYAKRKWMRIIMADEKAEEKIYWQYENEKWVMLKQLPEICENLYPLILEEGKPIFSEMPFDFMAYGIRFKGRIDEIRKEGDKIIITDFKSGNPWIGDMKLNFDPQLTLYNAGLRSVVSANEEVARLLGLNREEVKNSMINGNFIDDRFEERFFMLEAPAIAENMKRKDELEGSKRNYPTSFYVTKRTEEHFHGLINMVKGLLNIVAIPNQIYGEWGKKCDSCDMKIACKEKSQCLDDKLYFYSKNQGFFSFSNQVNTTKPETNNTQKKFSLRYNIKTGLRRN